jgi:hypothetical protein
MFASCGEKITNHKFFWQPSCNPKSTTKLQPTGAFLRAININQGFLQKLEQFVFLVLFFFCNPPHDYFFCSPHELHVATRQHYTLQTSATK